MSKLQRALAMYHACMAHDHAVTAHFSGDSNVDHYTTFKTWEAKNGALVAPLRG